MTTPTTKLQVTQHILSPGCIEDFSGWPSAILSIYHILGLPLLSCCAIGPHLLQPTEQPRLADVFNLVVSAVTDIQSLVALYGPSRSAAPFVLPLLRILVHICAQEAMISTEAPFVRPRTKTPNSDDFDGVATMLACHVLEGDVRLPSSEDSRTVASETAYPGASSHVESDPSPSFNGPLGAHILPGRGVHAYAALPFLCIADQDNIVDLMTSVACQRHVWGDPDPVVGFVLSGAVMRLVLSWLDPATSTVHIASSTSNGVFDLTDTASALSFTQFIFNLPPHFASILERAKELSKVGFGNNALDWRLDNLLPSHESEDWRDRVVQWLRNVEMPPSPLSLPTTSPSTEMSPNPSQQSTGERSTKSEQSEIKRKSSSSYADRAIRDLADPEGQLLTWMFDRSVQTIGRIPFVALPDRELRAEQEDINKKIAFYDDMCGLRRLDDGVTLPPVDEAVSPIRQQLISQLPVANPTNDLPVLPPLHQKILFGRLSGLLSAVAGAYTMRAKRHNVPVYEAESRHDWDALLYHFYCQATDVISPYVMLEHMLVYPRNDLADEIPSPSVLTSDFILNYSEHRLKSRINLCQDAQQSALVAQLGKPISELARSAFIQASDVNSIWLEYLGNTAELWRLIAERSDLEPAQGKCDAILFMMIPKKPDLSKKLGIIQQAKSAGSASGEGASGDGATTAKSNKSSGSARATPKPRNPLVVRASDEGAPGDSATTAKSKKTVRSARATPKPGNPAVVRRINDSLLERPFAATTPGPPPVPHNGLPPVGLTSFHGDLLLPHATAEYKKHGESESKALNQGRFYLISVVSFYAALGIVDRPFYGIITEGNRGAILMAWKSKPTPKPESKSKKQPQSKSEEPAQIYIIERNVCLMDISKPLEAFQFATFLIRLREDQEDLKKLVQKKLDANETAVVAKFEQWRKSAQPRLLPAEAQEAGAQGAESTVQRDESTAQGKEAPVTPPALIKGIIERNEDGAPTAEEMHHNLKVAFPTPPPPPSDGSIGPGFQIMVDEIKVEGRMRWDPRSNMILGICREHSANYELQFLGVEQAEALHAGLADGTVHLASEATVIAVSSFSDIPVRSIAHPFVVAPTCKRETADAQKILLCAARDAVNAMAASIGGRLQCISSDGDRRRRQATLLFTFTKLLDRNDDLFGKLGELPLFDYHCGEGISPETSI
ncbi:hypothetical protein DFH07DRAFT_1059213 [Mycena maculata]|uniref:Uncharacterized protein n=1 Tax=Mycena maculata TaxID=230809 RepID=A0AAD7JJC1_9AGAR|nr:hypothetical protein DFH07DRAFT_1059213 [Mycena maculata]